MRTFWLILYYGFAAHLPKSTAPVMGEMARRLRHRCVSHLFASCGAYTCVENGAYFGSGKDFKVGTAVGIGRNFRSHNRIVTIHDALLMGEEVFFVGGGHSFADPDKNIGSGSSAGKTPLEIESDVWIGHRAMILPGCKHIGAHSIIGAGAVVTHDVPDYAVVGGNPARVIRYRK